MNTRKNTGSKVPTLQGIVAALESSYGNLAKPDFRNVYATLEGPLHKHLIDELKSNNIHVKDTTDLNDDVAIHLVLSRGQEKAALAISGVGQFAILREIGSSESNSWITHPCNASSLVCLIAKIVEKAKFTLLSRNTVMQSVYMTRADGSDVATLYQALFTDSDVIP